MSDPGREPPHPERRGPAAGWLAIVFAILLVAMSLYAALDWFTQLPDG